MASSIQLLRSTSPQERPFAGNLLEGQPAANIHSSEPGLFFKTTDGSIVKFGPAAITSDGSPPNSTPQGSSGNSVGELWLDKSVDPAVLKVYDGAQWIDAGSGGGGGSASFLRWIYTAIGGETSLSGVSSGVLLKYTSGLEELYVNGVLMTRGTDYSAVNGSSITNLQPLAAGDVITVLSTNPAETVQLPGQVTLVRWNITATSGQVSLVGSDSSGQVLDYEPGLEEIYVNGAFLNRGADYTATNGSSITLQAPLVEGDEVTVMIWSPFVVGELIGNADVATNAGIQASKLAFLQAETGAVSRSVQSRLAETISVKDFGAKGDGENDDTQAIAQAILAAVNTGRDIHFPVGTYLISDTLYPRPYETAPFNMGQAPRWIALGYQDPPPPPPANSPGKVTIKAAAGWPLNKPMIHARHLVGGSGYGNSWGMDGFAIDGIVNSSIGVKLTGVGGACIQNCIFTNHRCGVQFANDEFGTYTEQSVIKDSGFPGASWGSVGQAHVEFIRANGGYESFRGTGLVRTFHDAADGCKVIHCVGETLPYNSPLTIDVSWSQTTNAQPIITIDSPNFQPSFYGTINTEVFSGNSVTIASSDRIATLIGGVQGIEERFDLGGLYLAQSAGRWPPGTGALLNGSKLLRRSENFTLQNVSGTFDLPRSGAFVRQNGPLMVTVMLIGSGDQYLQTFMVANNGIGSGPILNQTNNTVFSTTGVMPSATYSYASDKITMTYDFSARSAPVDVYLTYNPLW